MEDFEEFFRKIQHEKLEEAGSLVEVMVDNNPVQGRMIRTDTGAVEVVVGDMTDYQIKMKIKRDFRQADTILDWMDRFMENPEEEFPTQIPAYEPVYGGPRYETREIRSIDLQMIQVLGAKRSLECDPFIKLIKEHAHYVKDVVDLDTLDEQHAGVAEEDSQRIAFRGFVDEKTYGGDEIHWRFNPYSIEGASMISYCQIKANTLQGRYHYLDKSYSFVYYLEESPLYIIHADAWAKTIEGVIPSMTAFSLACSRPFWRVHDARPLANVTLPVDFFLVQPEAENLPLYDIAQELIYEPKGVDELREEQDIYQNGEVDHEPVESKWELNWGEMLDETRVMEPANRRGKVEFTPEALYMARGSSQVYRQTAKQMVDVGESKWLRRKSKNVKPKGDKYFYSYANTRIVYYGSPPYPSGVIYWEEGGPYDKVLFYNVADCLWLTHDVGRVFIDTQGNGTKKYDITDMGLELEYKVMFQSSIPLYDGWCNKRGIVMIERGLPLPYFIRAVKGLTPAQRYELFSRKYGQGENVRVEVT